MKRNFEKWFNTFTDTVASYQSYVDFDKVYKNADKLKIELNLLNSLVGSKNVENEFCDLAKKYPQVLSAIPILIAVRETEIIALDKKGKYIYNFKKINYDLKQYSYFMRETGLFNLISNKIVSNLYDYVLGIEVGSDSNSRKNRIGDVMESIVEDYIIKAGFEKGSSYFKEIKTSELAHKFNIDFSAISNEGKNIKKFDFAIKLPECLYGIECNFYSSKGGGSKLNETARSYKEITIESQKIDNFKFVWITDGRGWKKAKNNLEETFDVLDHLYNLKDLEEGIIEHITND